MNKKTRFIAGLAVILLGSIFAICAGLLFILDVSIPDFRWSTQFDNDLNNDRTQEFLVDDFQTYKNTQRVNINGLNDFSGYSEKAMIIGWVDIEDYSRINSIDLAMSDASSSYILKGLDNKPGLARTENGIWTDDGFIDYSFSSNQSNNVWRDWMLANGENMIFWEWDGPLPLDMKAVTVKTSYPVRDAFIIKGFSSTETPTNGNWIAPNGLIQYGFHYVENGSLFMKNVRQTQMVTNGDHARIISNTKGTLRAFIMRVRFTPKNVQQHPTKNDYVRIAWDFEDKWDPGHDQTLVYLTGEYEYFGLQRVYPIVRQKEQGYENSPKATFKLKNNRLYEIDIRVQGQTARATIYERKLGVAWEKASIEYTFNTPRPADSYPFSIEATGNPNLQVDLIEVRQILE